jgi:hypothetical protein
MSDAPIWQPAALANALGVPDEAFRAFARLRGIGWESRLAAGDAAGLALAWIAADGSAGTGAIADAAAALLAAVESAVGSNAPLNLSAR